MASGVEYWVYIVDEATVLDGGGATMTDELNAFAAEGWRVVDVYSASRQGAAAFVLSRELKEGRGSKTIA